MRRQGRCVTCGLPAGTRDKCVDCGGTINGGLCVECKEEYLPYAKCPDHRATEREMRKRRREAKAVSA